MECIINTIAWFMEKIKSGKQFRKEILIDKKTIQDTDLIKLKAHPPVEDGSLSPIQSFLQLERFNGIQLVQIIHENLAALSKVIRGISLITNEIQEYAKDLLQNEVIQKNSLGTYYVIHGLDFSQSECFSILSRSLICIYTKSICLTVQNLSSLIDRLQNCFI